MGKSVFVNDDSVDWWIKSPAPRNYGVKLIITWLAKGYTNMLKGTKSCWKNQNLLKSMAIQVFCNKFKILTFFV
jgi:hypothetical protein